MPKRAGRSRRSPVRGVSVERRDGAHGPILIGRYTTADGRRPSLPGEATWDEAFEAARAAQDKLTRARFRDPAAAEMSFADLVAEHYLPTYAHASPITRKNLASHLGDGTGQPVRGGARRPAPPASHCCTSSARGRSRRSDRKMFGPGRPG